jgi:pyrimidine deaminase RibD-like protein
MKERHAEARLKSGTGFHARALELAERGRETTHPNPVVGAVVVQDGEVVGEGWHERRGGPHAEVVALDAAGERAPGATLYLTMEPCTHHGDTPPCTTAVIEAGIARVVAGSSTSCAPPRTRSPSGWGLCAPTPLGSMHAAFR